MTSPATKRNRRGVEIHVDLARHDDDMVNRLGAMHPPAVPGRQIDDREAAEIAIMHHGRLDPGVLLLAKPYRKVDLARMIRKALDASPRAPAASVPVEVA